MGYKMKGAPMIANTKSHGTNKNYKMSGTTNADGTPGGPPFKGLGKFAGNFIKGKGALGFLNPVGAIASRLGAFDKNKNTQADPNATAAKEAAIKEVAGQQANPVAQPNQPVAPQQPAADPTLAQAPPVPATPGATPPTAPVNPQEEMVTT